MRNLSALPELHTAADLLAFLREAPADRFVIFGSDLDDNDFTNGVATRVDTCCISVHSLRSMGVTRIADFPDARHAAGPAGRAVSELASVGSPTIRDRFGRVCPPEIWQLIEDADNKTANRQLCCCGFEDYFVLAEHPDAEQ